MSILALGKQQKKKKRKIPKKRVGERKKKGKKIPDQGSEENRRNIPKGLWTRQFLNKHLGGKPYRVQTSFQEPESEI